jgi:pyruvate dehydrogenase E1 component alpha subunit
MTDGSGFALDDSQAPLVQLLTPEGERVNHPDYQLEADGDQLRGLYRDLVLVRRFDDEATALHRQGELGQRGGRYVHRTTPFRATATTA